jgi:hypothetical protein
MDNVTCIWSLLKDIEYKNTTFLKLQTQFGMPFRRTFALLKPLFIQIVP